MRLAVEEEKHKEAIAMVKAIKRVEWVEKERQNAADAQVSFLSYILHSI